MKECKTWQDYIQTIVTYYSHGYSLVYGFCLPDRKKDDWDKLIKKIDTAYDANLSKSQRQKKRKKGLKTFLTACWDKYVAVCATNEGKFPSTINTRVQELFKSKYKLKAGEIIEVEIKEVYYNSKKHVTVFLTSETMRNLKEKIKKMLRISDDVKKQEQFKSFFSLLNKLPRYSGIMQQVYELKQFVKNKQHPIVTKITVKKYKKNRKSNTEKLVRVQNK